MLRVAEQSFRTDTGRQRTANEDSFFARAPLFAVADGMGGAQAGEVASRIAADAFGPPTGAASRPRPSCARIGGVGEPPRSTTSPRTTRAARGWGRR